ncbi:MAG: hypothetical protein H7Y88_10775 [Phycisphaerales bacterium]|nr:hypothetical protein [Phycisphaerales bacterium]
MSSFDPSLSTLDPAQSEGSDDAAAAALRLDLLGSGGEQLGLEAPAKSPLASQTALLVLLVVGAAAALGAMRYLGMGPRSSLADVKIEYDVNEQGGDPAKKVDHLRVLADLSQSHLTVQVPADQVQRNPFRMAGALEAEVIQEPGMPAPPETGAGAREAERLRQLAVEREKLIMSGLASLTINTIIGGDTGNAVARISGQTVRIGDLVDDLFTVTEIHGRGVVLTVDGKAYSLEMAAGDSAPNGPGRNTKRK